MRRTLLLAAALIAIPLAAIAQDQTPPPAPTTPDEFVAQREAKMGRGGGAMAAMKQAADDAGADLTALAQRIEWLALWSEELPTYFPEGSDTPASGARPEVWSDRTGFEAAAARFRTAVAGLAAPAAANDHAAFLTAWTAVSAACGACHDSYKQ